MQSDNKNKSNAHSSEASFEKAKIVRKRRNKKGKKALLFLAASLFIAVVVAVGAVFVSGILKPINPVSQEIVTNESIDKTNAESIINRFVELNGGVGRFEWVKSIRLEGTFGQGDKEFDFSNVKMNPHNFWMKLSDGDLEYVTAFNAKGEIWRKVSQRGQEVFVEVSEEEEKELKASYVLFNSLADYAMSGRSDAEFLGKVLLKGGTTALKIKLPATTNHSVSYVYLEEDSLMPVKEEETNASGQHTESYFSDYFQKQGFFIPKQIEIFENGKRMSQITLTSIHFNPGVLSFFFNPPTEAFAQAQE